MPILYQFTLKRNLILLSDMVAKRLLIPKMQKSIKTFENEISYFHTVRFYKQGFNIFITFFIIFIDMI